MDDIELKHPLGTSITTSAENSRKLLLAACQIDRSNFRDLITSQDPQTLQLYRGHSRFMFEDLSHSSYLTMSTSKRKKLGSEIGAEMIMVSGHRSIR
jgi:pyoverdine/dityrosine biosynthesis protein Dit1